MGRLHTSAARASDRQGPERLLLLMLVGVVAGTGCSRGAAPTVEGEQPTPRSAGDGGSLAGVANGMSAPASPAAGAGGSGAPAVTGDGAVAAAEPSGPCPEDMVYVDGWYCPVLPYVCRRYVDEAEYRCAEYVRERRCLGDPERRRFCIDRYEWPNRVGEAPRVYVSWHEAKQACRSVDKRLCRRSEWVLACEGPKRLPYPWGYVRQPSPCNIDRAPVPFDVGAMMDERDRDQELDRLWQADRIGAHPNCVSSYGVADMAGNVDEWTDNRADDPSTDHPSTLNGGYWGPVRDTCRLTTTKHGPEFRFYQVGFRCCRKVGDGGDGEGRP